MSRLCLHPRPINGTAISFLFSSHRMSSTTWIPNRYPPTRRSGHVDVYQSTSRGEVTVPDPYQWLEDHSDETDKWTSAQGAFTRDYLDRNPDLEKLKTAFRDCNDYPTVLNSVLEVTVSQVDAFDCSSAYPGWRTMVAGTGGTTAGLTCNIVRIIISIHPLTSRL